MKRITAGIVGLGFIGMAHIEALRRIGFADISAVSGGDFEVTKRVASNLGIPRVYETYHDLVRDPNVDVVHICTPNHLHFHICKEAILAGKHVLSEKPLALNTVESLELLRLAQEHRVIHCVNFNYRQFPMIQQLRAMVHHGKLGDVRLVHGNYLQDWLLHETDFNWRMLPEYGGASRAVADIGSHWINTVQHVIGQEVVEVFADLTTIMPTRKRAITHTETFQRLGDDTAYEEVAITTEDFASILMRFNKGARGSLNVSQVSAGRKNHFNIEVNGSRASASWNQERPDTLWIGHRDEPNQVLSVDPSLMHPEVRSFVHYPGGHNEGWPDAMKNAMLNYYTFIRDNKDLDSDLPNFETFEHGHRVMEIVEAVLESSRTAGWIRV